MLYFSISYIEYQISRFSKSDYYEKGGKSVYFFMKLGDTKGETFIHTFKEHHNVTNTIHQNSNSNSIW